MSTTKELIKFLDSMYFTWDNCRIDMEQDNRGTQMFSEIKKILEDHTLLRKKEYSRHLGEIHK